MSNIAINDPKKLGSKEITETQIISHHNMNWKYIYSPNNTRVQ